MLCFQYLQNLHLHKSKYKEYRVYPWRFIGNIDAIVSLISIFPFGLIGEHQWVPKHFMVTIWVDFASGNSNIFLFIFLLSFTQIAAILANALRCELSSIKPVVLSNLRTVSIRALKLSFALNNKPITFESTSPTPHQVWPRSTFPRGFKALFRIKWNIKNASPINVIW